MKKLVIGGVSALAVVGVAGTAVYLSSPHQASADTELAAASEQVAAQVVNGQPVDAAQPDQQADQQPDQQAGRQPEEAPAVVARRHAVGGVGDREVGGGEQGGIVDGGRDLAPVFPAGGLVPHGPRPAQRSRATASSSSRKSGWAMAARACARWPTVSPASSAAPYSVTITSTWWRGVVTSAPVPLMAAFSPQ